VLLNAYDARESHRIVDHVGVESDEAPRPLKMFPMVYLD
jgi:hypothetical protein